MAHRSILPALALTIGGWVSADAASAEIYRCERDSVPVFTDIPCAPGAEPLVTRNPTTVQASHNADLARRYDERLERERRERDRADAQWLGAHDLAQAEDQRLHRALIEGRVIKGMSPAQVRQVWGEPAQIQSSEAGERWTWRDGKKRRTVSFKDEHVRSVSGAP